MGTPVHDDDDVPGAAPSGASRGTESASRGIEEEHGVSASAEPVPPPTVEPPTVDPVDKAAEASKPTEDDRLAGPDRPVGAEKSAPAAKPASTARVTETAG